MPSMSIVMPSISPNRLYWQIMEKNIILYIKTNPIVTFNKPVQSVWGIFHISVLLLTSLLTNILFGSKCVFRQPTYMSFPISWIYLNASILFLVTSFSYGVLHIYIYIGTVSKKSYI